MLSTRALVALTLAAAPVAAQGPAPLRLTFADAVRLATGQAPVVRLADLRADEAAARVRQARAALLPDLSATAGWVNQILNSQSFGFKFPSIPGFPSIPEKIGPFNTYDARLHLTQTLFDFASLKRVSSARSGAASARALSGATAEGAAAVAAVDYLRAVRAQAAVAARQADSVIAADLLALAQAQLAAGVSASIDVTRARTQLATAASALVVARAQAERARLELAPALGLDPATPIVLADTLDGALAQAAVPSDADSALAAAYAQRADLAAELAAGRAAGAARAAILSERLPRLDLAADYGENGTTPSTWIPTGRIGVQVSLPIVDGFRREGRLSEQQAVLDESAVRVQGLRRQIAVDVNGSLLDLQAARAQEAIAAERLALAQEELAQARERFKAGVAGNIEVIDAQANLVRAEDAQIDARFAAASARVALARAVGAARTLH